MLRVCVRRSIPLEGKIQVWQHDVIPILVHLLKDKEEEVQANAAGALMNATVTTEGEAPGRGLPHAWGSPRAPTGRAVLGSALFFWAPPCHPLGSLVLEFLPLTQAFVNQSSGTDSLATPGSQFS